METKLQQDIELNFDTKSISVINAIDNQTQQLKQPMTLQNTENTRFNVDVKSSIISAMKASSEATIPTTPVCLMRNISFN